MSSYQQILEQLNQFTKRYYTKLLLKGVLLFMVLGVIFFFVTLGVEYFLWLGSTGRLVLFLFFMTAVVILLYSFIAIPLFYLFKLKKGITNKHASVLIGKHFPEVNDRLLNLLDLVEDEEQSELLVASINQRSDSLNSVAFKTAVDFSENLKYMRYLIVPILLFLLVWFSGNLSSFFGTYERVVNYDLVYEKPAPFAFKLLSEERDVLDSKSYTILATTIGDVRPDVVFVVINGKQLLMERHENGFQYSLSPPLLSIDYYFIANGFRSKNYRLNVLKTPAIQNFEIELDYPNYIKRTSEVLKGTGSAILPEGTQVKWKIIGNNTERVHLVAQDTSIAFNKSDNSFEFTKSIYSDLEYELVTSNSNVENYEKLAYAFEVVKDEYPKVRAQQFLDSINPNLSYYNIEATDDYILNSINIVYYTEADDEKKIRVLLSNPNSNFNQSYYTFPSGLELEEGQNYSFFFEAVDNDAIRGGKSSKSQVFTVAVLDVDQLKNKQLEFQESILDNMDRSLENFKDQKETLEDISKEQKEKNSLSFNDKSQVKDFLKKQERQESLMQKFSKQLKENLNKSEKNDELSEMLKERLERQEIQAKKNEKLLEELQKVADKINKEELAKRLEEIGNKQKNSERNLDQLLELTKRYYVTEKASQLAKDLEKLSKRQDYLTDIKIGQDFSNKEQQKLNDDFKEIAKDLNELEKDNAALKKPLELSIDKEKEEAVKQDQNDALEQINKHEGLDESSDSETKEKASKTAAQKQKSAAQKMQEMSEQLQQSSSAAGGKSGAAEDAEMLRQILDNLVTFSFKQENLYDKLKEVDNESAHFSGNIRKQQELKGLFEHVDDSLFALSLRRAELSEFVNEQITEVYYNMDKTLESMAESRLIQGVSYQKYVLSASNSLADFLARILENMQQSMQMGQGQGQSEGQEFQLPDIIKGQGELKEKMDQMGQSGQGKPGQGEEGKQGEGKKPGEGGEKGEGKEGSSGQDGQMGENGAGEKQGEGGKKGSGQGNGQEGGEGQVQPSEQELQELYEIYKEQQMIRQQLENQLKDMINSSDQNLAKKLLKQMEDFENDLIENGVTRRTQNKMNTIQHQLLKLENAALKQGKKQERESKSNQENFQNPITTKPAVLEDYRNEIEILNRQDLPLLQNYRNKVKQYFQKDD
ncbi:hypothetical protein JQC67_03660 [Aurantibacter crassamenti]|uniref:DUF4175 family protein n=1 Tax=Aurantibacter crassamenti TaxID=1837375 RepID=UPI00193A065F|nr:DUF4175 family protein [Aurantibacter crassamenti]MBM1105229.1 hypothetical protein [Aurantibacter crassamenti]